MIHRNLNGRYSYFYFPIDDDRQKIEIFSSCSSRIDFSFLIRIDSNFLNFWRSFVYFHLALNSCALLICVLRWFGSSESSLVFDRVTMARVESMIASIFRLDIVKINMLQLDDVLEIGRLDWIKSFLSSLYEYKFLPESSSIIIIFQFFNQYWRFIKQNFASSKSLDAVIKHLLVNWALIYKNYVMYEFSD